MFIQGVIRRRPSRTGIRSAHRSSDKLLRDLYDAETFPKLLLSGLAIALEHPSRFKTTAHHHHYYYYYYHNHQLLLLLLLLQLLLPLDRQYNYHSSWIASYVVQWVDIGPSLLSLNINSYLLKLILCDCLGSITVSTVRALYAGTLATIWTTAPSLPQRPAAQLAAVCLFLAALTIEARCYASSNATHPIVQFEPNPSSFSPIDNSNAQISHSSNLVLSRLLKSPHQPVQSDTSVIVLNSKKLLHHQNSNSEHRKRFRTKREFKSSLHYNSITSASAVDHLNYKDKTVLGANKRFKDIFKHKYELNLEKRSDVSIQSSSNSSVGDSVDRVNASLVDSHTESDHQNDSSFSEEEDTTSKLSEGTQRPMPPVHDHGKASSVSDLGILVLVISAIVLTVALGLITCVLSHYRPVAGEGAADGGTAADPHDAAQTPTTAPMLSVVSAGAAAGVGGMDRLRGGRAARELAATRDRQVRLHAVHTDLAINLPPSIAMPDGEEHPFTSSRLHIRDSEQESEIHQKCIRPPPNRTVLESESPPPFRSSSAGLLSSSTSSSTTSSSSSGSGGVGCDWSGGGSAPLVVRCHSMSSSTSSKRPEAGSSGQKTDFLHRTVKIFTGGKKTAAGGGGGAPSAQSLPVVIVPTRSRRTSSDQPGAATPRSKPSV